MKAVTVPPGIAGSVRLEEVPEPVGAGPIGLLAALIGVQQGADIHVLDRVTSGPKPAWSSNWALPTTPGPWPTSDCIPTSWSSAPAWSI